MVLWAPVPSVSRTWNLPILSIAIDATCADRVRREPDPNLTGIRRAASKPPPTSLDEHMTPTSNARVQALRPGDLRPARPPGAGPVHPRRGSTTSSWAWAMDDPALKVQLFRFVDALPYLKRPGRGRPAPARVPRRGRGRAARGGRGRGASSCPSGGLLGQAAGAGRPGRTPSGWPASSSPARTSPRRSTPSHGCATRAARVHHRPARRGDHHRGRGRPRPEAVPRPDRRADPRGERLAGDPADRPRRPRADPARQRLGQALGALQPVRPDRPGRAPAGPSCDRLRPILPLAKQTGAFVNFDMEQYAFKDMTLRSSARC